MIRKAFYCLISVWRLKYVGQKGEIFILQPAVFIKNEVLDIWENGWEQHMLG